MSVTIDFDRKSALPKPTESSDLWNLVIARTRLLRIARPGLLLGIGGLFLPLALAMLKDFRLTRLVCGAADRVINRPNSL